MEVHFFVFIHLTGNLWRCGLEGLILENNNSTVPPEKDKKPGYAAMGLLGSYHIFQFHNIFIFIHNQTTKLDRRNR